MINHEITPKKLAKGKRSCTSTIGGRPVVANGESVPECRLCRSRMVLFIQIEIEERFQLPFGAGSQLAAFMCPRHNEIHSICPDTRRNYQVKSKSPFRKLRDGYWRRNPGHFKLWLLPPDAKRQVEDADEFLVPHELTFEKREEQVVDNGLGRINGAPGFKVGGLPAWSQDPEYYQCSCGGTMSFICQVPDGYGFAKLPAAPEQPNSFSASEYCLFLGNDVYLFGCADQCRPEAVWPVLQN